MCGFCKVIKNGCERFQEHKKDVSEKLYRSLIEGDVILWFIRFIDQSRLPVLKNNLSSADFKDPNMRLIFDVLIKHYDIGFNFSDIVVELEKKSLESINVLTSLLKKRINLERTKEFFIESIQKLLDVNWMDKKEEIRIKIQSGEYSDDKAMVFVHEFEFLKRNPPKVKI